MDLIKSGLIYMIRLYKILKDFRTSLAMTDRKEKDCCGDKSPRNDEENPSTDKLSYLLESK